MRSRAGRIILTAVCGVGLLAGLTHAWVLSLVHSPGFMARAESELGRLLSAEVSIGSVHVGLFNRITLHSLVVQTSREAGTPLLMQVDRIDFRYSLVQLITRRIAVPSGLVFQQPRVNLNENGLFRALMSGQDKFGSAGLRELRMNGGEMSYRFSSDMGSVLLTEVEGVLSPAAEGVLELHLDAKSRGLINGLLRIDGTWGLDPKTRKLKVAVQEFSPGEELPLPLEQGRAEVVVHGDGIDIQNLEASFHGWNIQLKGKMLQQEAGPQFTGALVLGDGEDTGRLSGTADFGKKTFSGKLTPPQRESLPFEGRLHREGSRVEFGEIHLPDGVEGKGSLDFHTGDYRFHFEKGRQRLSVVSNLRGLDFRLQVDLNHLKLYGADIVTRASIRLIPASRVFEDRPWRFYGELQTDYLILESTPFDDFRGEFEAGPFGLRDLRATWGKSFSAEGDMRLREDGPEVKLSVAVRDFDLRTVREFWNRPLPANFGGRVDGKLQIEGAIPQPEVTGHFRVRDGSFGRLDYDSGVIRFRGFVPYLPLEESKIMRGRMSLDLVGALDFSLENMFYGVRVQTGDKLVLWKGWALNTSAEEGDLEIDPSLNALPLIHVFVGQNQNGHTASDQEVFQDEGYVGAGPKLKF